MPANFDESKHKRDAGGRFSTTIDPKGPEVDAFYGAGKTTKDGSTAVKRVPQLRYEGTGSERGVPIKGIKAAKPLKTFKI